jgi:hypothetical protein
MTRIDYGQVPEVKHEPNLRTIYNYVRRIERINKYGPVKWIDNKNLNSNFKEVSGQSCVGQNKETGKWRILFVCEKVA